MNQLARQRAAFFAMALLVLALAVNSGRAQDDKDVLHEYDFGEPFAGITPENVQEKIKPFIAAAKKTTDKKKKGQIYYILVSELSSRRAGAAIPDQIIEFADAALEAGLPPLETVMVYDYKAFAIRRKHSRAKGDELKRRRKEMARSLLKGLKHAIESVKDFHTRNPNFDINKPPPFPMPTNWPGPGKSPGQIAFTENWHKKTQDYQQTQRLELIGRLGLSRVLSDVYATAPYDFEELGSLAREIIGDDQEADRLVDLAKKELALRMKLAGKDEMSAIEKELLADVALHKKLPVANRNPQRIKPTTSTPAAGKASSAPPMPSANKSNLSFILMLAGGAALIIVLAAFIIFRRRNLSR